MQARPTLSDMLANLQQIQANARQQATVIPMVAPVGGAVPRLLGMLREFAGFRGNDHLQRKLAKVFEGMSTEELERWVNSLANDASGNELLALVEDLTNHETYFFRDTPQLDILAQHILPKLVQEKIRSGDKTLKIWSAACSTGEEAWTLALMALKALLDAGIARESRPGEVWLPPNWRLEVLGTDISRQAIRVARGGAYRTEAMASFRQFPTEYSRFFEASPSTANPRQGDTSGYRSVKTCIRPFVRFELFNLVTKTPPCRDADLILCRNVLIYLDPAAHPSVQRMLRDALRPRGYLMQGVVDRLHARDDFTDHWFDRCVIHERK